MRLADATNGRGPVPAVNLIMLATLDARQGHELSASITGPDAVAARDALRAWAEGGFGEAG